MPCLSLKHITRTRASYQAYQAELSSYRRALRDYEQAMIRLDPSFRPQESLIVRNFKARIAQIKAQQIWQCLVKLSRQGGRKIRQATRRAAAKSCEMSKKLPGQLKQRAVSVMRRQPAIDDPIAKVQAAKHPSRADLINAESRLGSTIFGPIPEGHRREFFHDRENVWIWHEDWSTEGESTEDTSRHQLTVRYEVKRSGVYKKVSAGKYLRLEGDELENFRRAAHAYLNLIKAKLYVATEDAPAPLAAPAGAAA